LGLTVLFPIYITAKSGSYCVLSKKNKKVQKKMFFGNGSRKTLSDTFPFFRKTVRNYDFLRQHPSAAA
jgi:hypothetical protein